MITHRRKRQLYDLDYLNSNCTLPYDVYTNIDDLGWTSTMSFVVFGVTILASPLIWYKSGRKQTDRYPAWNFIAVSISNGLIPGITRQRMHSTENLVLGSVLRRTYLIASQIGHMILMYIGIRSLSGKLSYRDFWLMINITVLVLAALDVVPAVSLFGFLVFIFTLGVFIYLAMEKDIRIWVKVVAMVILLVGCICEACLDERCGEAAYEKCFSDCPLPKPSVFNHRALQLCLAALGYVIYAVGEILVPAASLFKEIDPPVVMNSPRYSGESVTRMTTNTPTNDSPEPFSS